MNLRDLQEQQPWAIPYSREFVAAEVRHKDFQHAMIHAMKALGNLSAYIDHTDHGRYAEVAHQDIHNWVADLVNCAIRMANTFPAGKFNLERAVIERMEGKNGVTLRSEVPEGCILIAHDTGDGWYLGVETFTGETVAALEWPASWPESMSAARLRDIGFKVV